MILKRLKTNPNCRKEIIFLQCMLARGCQVLLLGISFLFLSNKATAQQATVQMLGTPPYGNGVLDYMLSTKDSGFVLLSPNTADSAICSCVNVVHPDTNQDYHYIIKKFNKNNQIIQQGCIKFHERFWKKCSLASGPLQYIELCDDGNFIMGGVFDDSVGVIIKVDSQANILWMQKYSGTRYGVGIVKRTKDNGFIFSTSNNYAGGLFDVHYGNWTTFDGLVVKTDSLGNVEYHKVYGSPADDGFIVIPNLIGEDYLFLGGTNNIDPSYPDYFCGSMMPSYMQMWGVDKNFYVKWKKCYLHQYNRDLQGNVLSYLLDSSNSIVLSWGGDSILSNEKFVLGNYDSLGNIKWHKGFGPDSSVSGINYIGGIERNPIDNAIVLSTSCDGFSGDVENIPWIPHYIVRSWTLFFNTSGDIIGQHSLGGNHPTYATPIRSRPYSNQFVLLGFSFANSGNFIQSNITVNNDLENYYEGYYAILDYWPLSVTHISDKEKKLTMYPNPSRSGFTIILPSENEKEIEVNVRNVSGQLVQHNSFQAHQKNIIMSTSNLSNGLYFVEVKQGKDVYIGKLLKE